jgi:hypothetical protein
MDTTPLSTTPLSFDVPNDAELEALAIAADPAAPIDLDAEPYYFGQGFNPNALPTWYMPSPMAARRGAGTKAVVISIVAGMMVVCAFGLCITSGFLQWA